LKSLPVCQTSREPPLHREVCSAKLCYLASINLSRITDKTPSNEMSISSTINVSEVNEIYEQEYFTRGGVKSLVRPRRKQAQRPYSGFIQHNPHDA